MLTYSLGELVDKLCVANIKISAIENEIDRIKHEEPENIKSIEPLLNQVVSLNSLRVKIVESINEIVERT